jgi:hypothetical protein
MKAKGTIPHKTIVLKHDPEMNHFNRKISLNKIGNNIKSHQSIPFLAKPWLVVPRSS